MSPHQLKLTVPVKVSTPESSCPWLRRLEKSPLPLSPVKSPVPLRKFQRDKGSSKRMRNDPLRSPSVQVKTFKIAPLGSPCPNLPPQWMIEERAARAAKLLRALLTLNVRLNGSLVKSMSVKSVNESGTFLVVVSATACRDTEDREECEHTHTLFHAKMLMRSVLGMSRA